MDKQLVAFYKWSPRNKELRTLVKGCQCFLRGVSAATAAVSEWGELSSLKRSLIPTSTFWNIFLRHTALPRWRLHFSQRLNLNRNKSVEKCSYCFRRSFLRFECQLRYIVLLVTNCLIYNDLIWYINIYYNLYVCVICVIMMRDRFAWLEYLTFQNYQLCVENTLVFSTSEFLQQCSGWMHNEAYTNSW